MRRDTFVKMMAAGSALQLGFSIPHAAADELRGSFEPNAWVRIDPDDRITVMINKAEMGQGIATGLCTIVADELDAAFERVRFELAPAEDRFNDPRSGAMATGGSTSIRDMWIPLRVAGATARAMLIQAAAKRWDVDPKKCTTVSGSVLHTASRRSATYGSLVQAAAALRIPDDPPLKNASQWRLIGKHDARLDVAPKLDGSARFGIDVRLPGMLYAAVLRCPVFGGRVKSFDAAGTKTVNGVRDAVRISSGIAVIADNTWAAFQGKSLLRATWDEGNLAGWDTAALFAEAERLSKGATTVAKHVGDVTSARGVVTEAIYRGPFLAHATMEPMNATADVRSDRCDVWAPTQVPTASRAVAQRITGLPLEKVTVRPTFLGSGFGRRLETDYVQEAVEISKAVRRPVQVVWTREDDIQHDFYRPMSLNAVRAVTDQSGMPAALSHTVVSPAAMRTAVNQATPPYTIPNLEIAYVQQDHGIPVGALRAPGANWNVFVVESFIDELTHAAKRDALAFRLSMLRENPRAASVLRLAADRGGWRSALPSDQARGIALGLWNGSYAALVARVSMQDGAPKVHQATVAVDCGTVVNPDIVIAQAQSAVNYGLSAALASKITIKEGRVEQSNFDDYSVLRYADAPSIDVHIVPSSEVPTGIGELGTPVIAPAVANAVFVLTGKRVRTLPFRDALAG
jgi:isoquinoline 1-oxidoreductase beta subunit